MNTLIEILPVVVLSTHFLDKYLLSKGQLFPVYVLMIIGSSASALFNVLLFLDQHGAHKSVLLFSCNSVWAILMAVKGLVRIRKENGQKQGEVGV